MARYTHDTFILRLSSFDRTEMVTKTNIQVISRNDVFANNLPKMKGNDIELYV